MANEKDYLGQENKEQSVRHTFSKYEFDLFKDEDHVALPVIRVKRIKVSNKKDKWKIFEDNKLVLTIEGDKLNKKERKFLYSAEGVSFIITQYKKGCKSINSIKISLKEKLGGGNNG